MITDRIQVMLEACSTSSRTFPPTILYNESWLLRIILDWFSTHQVPNHPLTFLQDAHWFAEAALPSQFLNNPNGTRLAEGWSHADGVIGHFDVGKDRKHRIDLTLRPDGTQFAVLEAKMFSPLASRTSNVNYYDQAARTVGCIAETLARANRLPTELTNLGFYVLAPESIIDQGSFLGVITCDSINNKVERRVKEYVDSGHIAKNEWYSKWFLPTLRQIKIGTLKWENVIADIRKYDAVSSGTINEFYDKCLKFGSQPWD